MKAGWVLATVLVGAISLWANQSGAPAAAVAAGDQGASIPARLSKALDSSKAKQGDAVVATTAALVRRGDGTVIPSGTKIFGHVTEATSPSKGDVQSSIAMVFDRIQLGGKELKIHGTLQAIAPGVEADTGAGGSGTLPTYGLDGGTMPSPSSANAGNLAKNAPPSLNPQSKGVVGFRDLDMGLDSLLTSNTKRIKLNAGTQLMLNVQFE